MRVAPLVLLVCTACGVKPIVLDAGSSDSGAQDAGRDAGAPAGCRTPDGGAPTFGLNDVSMLVPLTVDLVPVTELIPRALYDRVVKSPDFGGTQDFLFDSYDRFHVVAVRFDLCDRAGPGACPTLDPRFRLVLQRVAMARADDNALHAFFTVPAGALQGILAELEALARLEPISTQAPLQVRTMGTAYQQRLAALIRRFCSTATLSRLTFFAQPDIFAQIRWVFRGVELQNGSFADIAIPHATDGGIQHVFLSRNGYEITMLADVPAGFARVTSETAMAGATPAQAAEALASLAEINDPLARHVDSLQCVACHVATPLVEPRRDAGAVPPRFTSGYDLSLDGGVSPARLGSLRAFGWLGQEPMISQRVVNETAQLLAELQQCR